MYEGEEYKDILYITTPVKRPSLRLRLAVLFCTNLTFEHKVYTKEVMPSHQAMGIIHTISLWDRINHWRRRRAGLNLVSPPSNNNE